MRIEQFIICLPFIYSLLIILFGIHNKILTDQSASNLRKTSNGFWFVTIIYVFLELVVIFTYFTM